MPRCSMVAQLPALPRVNRSGFAGASSVSQLGALVKSSAKRFRREVRSDHWTARGSLALSMTVRMPGGEHLPTRSRRSVGPRSAMRPQPGGELGLVADPSDLIEHDVHDLGLGGVEVPAVDAEKRVGHYEGDACIAIAVPMGGCQREAVGGRRVKDIAGRPVRSLVSWARERGVDGVVALCAW